MARIWAGIDIGKQHHHCVVVDAEGRKLLSRKVSNDESSLLDLIGEVLDLDGDVVWAVDVNRGGAALLIGVLTGHDQPVVYLTGFAVHRASASYRGEGKTDAKDAYVIADQARMRHDLMLIRPGDDVAADLQGLTAWRRDLAQDRTRAINRLRAVLLEIFPTLERVLDITSLGPVELLTKYQTPQAIRDTGFLQLEAWLRLRKVYRPDKLATKAVEAAEAQRTVLPGQDVRAAIVARLAEKLLDLHNEIKDLDKQIDQRFRRHQHATVILSLPGMGPRLAAEFVAATGGNMATFGTSNRLAGFAGLAPAPRDSGRISGNLRRPRRFNRQLLQVFYLSSMVSLQTCPASRVYYDRKRTEGKGHKQAVLALARRRLNVLWAMIQNNTHYQHPETLPATT